MPICKVKNKFISVNNMTPKYAKLMQTIQGDYNLCNVNNEVQNIVLG